MISKNGLRKSIILLMSMSENEVLLILKHLTTYEIKEIINFMIINEKIFVSDTKNVLNEYNKIYKKYLDNNFLKKDHLTSLLINSFGEKNKKEFLNYSKNIKINKKIIQTFNLINPNKIGFLIKNEHPQIISMILICLNYSQSSKILLTFDKDMRNEIIYRISNYNGIELFGLVKFNKIMKDILKKFNNIILKKSGYKISAKILNYLDIKEKNSLLKNIFNKNKNLACKIIKNMFSLNDILDLSDQDIKIFLKNINLKKLSISLIQSNNLLKEKIFQNISKKNAKKILYYLNDNIQYSIEDINSSRKYVLKFLIKIFKKKFSLVKKLGNLNV
ncbi:MAG: hypothetical protein G8D24_01645 [Buchnera aphidicola (Periphyllus lyropictus)]|uniref:FliG C-terminal domain-containing protein n=1 Tax=Buchnera aphidicola TaxID=9 RepID=UPI001ECFD1F9|nr:FliG C-terminal domain-containing protein [Buchnera aphidicola]NIH16752.1 hypothetical protein [Buchnera aphidicola (Periphyllus lyropictus)]USS94653.1 hypothetical protein M5J13_00250 [Buchnera aphidicola (Periphyllus lyropictus)]